MQNKNEKKSNGFTLIEVIVTMAIFAILATAMLATFSVLTKSVKAARQKIALSSLASNYLEIVRNMPYSQVGTVSGNPHGTLPDFPNAYTQTTEGITYKIYYEVTYIDDPADGTALASTDPYPADYKQVKMDILNTATNQLNDFVTSVVPKGLEGTNNQGALRLEVTDSTGNPLSGINLHITYPTTSPTIILDRQTDASGYWIEVGLPLAVNNYRIVASSAGYSTDQTYPVTLTNPNPLHPDATVASGTVTSITFHIDPVSNLNIKTLNQICQPTSNINVNIKGAKLIGTATSTPPSSGLYKYNQSFGSVGGVIALTNIEPDTYTPTLLTGQSVIAYGTSPIQKIDVLPSTTQTYTMILGPNSTANSLLVIVKDAATGAALENASIQLAPPSGPTLTGLTGGSVWIQNNWQGGSGQTQWSTTTPSQYFVDNGQVDVSTPGTVTLKKVGGVYGSATGTLESATFDTGTNATNYTILTWQPASQSASTTVSFQVAANNDNATWNYIGPDGTPNTYFTTPGVDMGSALDGNEYIRYKAYLKSTNPAKTPSLTSVSVNFVTGCFTPGQSIFTGLSVAAYNLTVSLSGYQTQNNIPISVNGNQSFEVDMSP